MFFPLTVERVDPGPNGREVNSVAQIVGCDFPEIGEFLATMFSRITSEQSIYVGNIEVAEAAKLIENVQRDIDIAFANELAMVLTKNWGRCRGCFGCCIDEMEFS